MILLPKRHRHITMHLISLAAPLQLGLQDRRAGRLAPLKTESCRFAQWPKSPKWKWPWKSIQIEQIIQNCTEQYRIPFFWGALEICWFAKQLLPKLDSVLWPTQELDWVRVISLAAKVSLEKWNLTVAAAWAQSCFNDSKHAKGYKHNKRLKSLVEISAKSAFVPGCWT